MTENKDIIDVVSVSNKFTKNQKACHRRRKHLGKLKTYIKKFDNTVESFINIQSCAASCSRKGVIPKNRANRIISRYSRKIKNVL